MPSDLKLKYGTSNQAITITLASLANAGVRSGLAVDNSSNLFVDALVQLKVKTGTGSSATGLVTVFAYASSDGGTTYPDGCGTDTGTNVTMTNLRRIGVINTPAAQTTYISSPMSVAAAFGGILPEKWGIAVWNNTGAALDSTEGSFAKFYQGVLGQSV